jgi:hypothetical protein
MKRIALALFGLSLAGGLLALPVATAGEREAESCLRARIWDGYKDDWAVRTATSTTLAQEEYRIYLVTLYAGNEYKVMACADDKATNIDLVLHDADGNVLKQDTSENRQPELLFKPDATSTYFVVVHATALTKAGSKSGVGMAVTYR